MRYPRGSMLLVWVALAAIATGCFASGPDGGSQKDRDALTKTSEGIRAAFASGDVDAILSYHHPDVVKALAYDKFLIGRNALKAEFAGTLRSFRLEFAENKVESLLITGDTAVEISAFTIKGTPKGEGEPFVFKGRAMVVYVRYQQSPTGWASIREVIQPGS